MHSDAPLSLSRLAREIAGAVQGAAHSLDEVGETAYAIEVGEQHALLLVAHGPTFGLSLAAERHWNFSTIADFSAVRREVDDAIQSYRARYPRTPGVADAILALAPVMRDLTEQTNSLRFSGTPQPSEGWVEAGTITAGVFLLGETIRVTLGIEGDAASQQLDDIGQLASLVTWAKPLLEAQISRDTVR